VAKRKTLLEGCRGDILGLGKKNQQEEEEIETGRGSNQTMKETIVRTMGSPLHVPFLSLTHQK
jgi:hypothetical protein